MFRSILSRLKEKIRLRKDIRTVRPHLNSDWYLSSYEDVRAAGVDASAHFIHHGWAEGRDPTPSFSVISYVQRYADVAEAGDNPFVHYIRHGLREGRVASAEPSACPEDVSEASDASDPLDAVPDDIEVVRPHFNAEWYLKRYPDVDAAGVDPLEHFIDHGWMEGRDPTPSFSTTGYEQRNEDVAELGLNPFVHYIRHGLREGRSAAIEPPAILVSDYTQTFHDAQNKTFPLALERADKVMVIVVPEHNEMSGGIYSFFSIARTVYGLRSNHDYQIVIMTRPNLMGETYTRQRHFRNAEDVFRFEQIQRCAAARTLYIHVPEYAAQGFVGSLSPDVLRYLKSRERLYINILNQKIDIMPEKEAFDDLRYLADELSQSVAHHAYFSQAFAERYDLPTLLLPAYTDLSEYKPIPFDEKQKLIIYSPDDAPWRRRTLQALRKGLPDYELREIRGVTFDAFMDLATRCRFSITFGEGFDGYLAQPIHQGGISFGVYNEEFFPSESLKDFANIFESGDDMADNIVSRIRVFETDSALLSETNTKMIGVYESLYSYSDYRSRIKRLIDRDFDLYPHHVPLVNESTEGMRPAEAGKL